MHMQVFSMQPLRIHRRVAGTFFGYVLVKVFAVLLRNKKAAPPYHLLPVPRCINTEVYYIFFLFYMPGRTKKSNIQYLTRPLSQVKIFPNIHIYTFFIRNAPNGEQSKIRSPENKNLRLSLRDVYARVVDEVQICTFYVLPHIIYALCSRILSFFYICVFLPLNMQVNRYGGERVQYIFLSQRLYFSRWMTCCSCLCFITRVTQ
jgi:hypothetical protein